MSLNETDLSFTAGFVKDRLLFESLWRTVQLRRGILICFSSTERPKRSRPYAIPRSMGLSPLPFGLG